MAGNIEPGCLARVVWGLRGADSPNINLVVRVQAYVGEERTFGRIWRCEAEYGERIMERPNIPLGLVDFAETWLKKIDPDTLPPSARIVKLKETA